MSANRKVDKTTTRSPSWQFINIFYWLPLWRSGGSFINFSIARHDGDRVVDLSSFLLPAMMARQPIEKLIKVPPDRHHGSQ
jgi:hypothetical protein